MNRVWFHVMGRGIVEPVDDFRDSNPASNDELLDGLTAEFVKDGYHLKALVRSIVRSRTYQLSASTNSFNVDDSLYFSHAQTKLLPAEVLLDAISTVTGTTTKFDGLPTGSRATQIPDGKMDNPFLKTFGRPAASWPVNASGRASPTSRRPSSSSEGPRSTANSTMRMDGWPSSSRAARRPPQITRELYLAALCREPSKTETEAAVRHLSSAKDLRQAVEDLGWVLINSKEFLFRH